MRLLEARRSEVKGADLVKRCVFSFGDTVGFQGAGEFAFAGAEVLHDGRQDNVGSHAIALGGGTVDR